MTPDNHTTHPRGVLALTTRVLIFATPALRLAAQASLTVALIASPYMVASHAYASTGERVAPLTLLVATSVATLTGAPALIFWRELEGRIAASITARWRAAGTPPPTEPDHAPRPAPERTPFFTPHHTRARSRHEHAHHTGRKP